MQKQKQQQNKISKTLVKGCSWFMLLYQTGIFLLIGVILFFCAIWLRKNNFTPMEAIATGRYIVDPKSQIFSYEIEYYVDGKNYKKFETFGKRVLTLGDKVEIYVAAGNPDVSLTDKPNKISNICFIVSFVCFLIFLVSFFLAWKYPTFFCSASILSQIF